MAVRHVQVFPHFRCEQYVKLGQVFLGSSLQNPLDFTIASIDSQPVTTDEPPSLIGLQILNHYPEEIPRGVIPTAIVPYPDLL